MKTAIFLYETSQLASLDALIAKWSDGGVAPTIVSLDAEIDFALEKRGVPFVSGKTLQNRASPATYVRAEEMARSLYDDERMSFLKYRDVPLADSLRFSTHVYLVYLLYYVDAVERFRENAPDVKRFVVPVSVAPVSKTSDPLAVEESKMIHEAARLVCERNGILCEAHDMRSSALSVKNKRQAFVFETKRVLFGVVLSFMNAFMALRPRRQIRIVASDYWKSLAPILHQLPEAELILLDR
ncbi:MAG: hypothetical protein G01um101491_282, partial [Parcubacteria group bacterium Gr01-1014_91]